MPKTYDVNLPDKTGNNGNGSTKGTTKKWGINMPEGFERPSPFIRSKYWAIAQQIARDKGLKAYEGLDIMLSAYYEQHAETLKQIEELMNQL